VLKEDCGVAGIFLRGGPIMRKGTYKSQLCLWSDWNRLEGYDIDIYYAGSFIAWIRADTVGYMSVNEVDASIPQGEDYV
jgi:hypothetical protein